MGLLETHINGIFPGCLETYSSKSEDSTLYNLPNWIPLDNYSHFTAIEDICPKPWRYQTEMNTLSHEAVRHSYNGGGYVADLGYNKESALKVINDLRDNNWVDALTAAVFIEFTLFDPASSLFCDVRHAFERLPTGGTLTAVDVRALTLYPSTNAHFQSFYEVCQLLFLVVIVIWFIAEMVKYFRQKHYFRQVWNWIELILIMCSFVAVVMSLIKEKYTSLYVKDIQANPYGTFSSDYIVRWLDQETLWLSLAIFTITLKLLRLIRFNHHICQTQGTLKRSVQPLFSFSLVFSIVLFAFTQFCFLCFGANLEIFSSIYVSLRAVLLMAVGKQIGNVDLYHLYPILGSLFLFFYLCVMIFIMINVFVGIFVDAYGEVRENQGEEFYDAELGNFMYNVCTKRIQELPGKIISGMRQLLNILSQKTPGRNLSMRNATASSLIDPRHDESKLDDIDYVMFEPLHKHSIPVTSPNTKCPQEHNSHNESAIALDANDCEAELDLLADIKTRFMEIAAELDFVSYDVGAEPNKMITKLYVKYLWR